MYTIAGALLMLAGFTAAEAQPMTLTLACKGTTTFTATGLGDAKLEPISMGIIVNFTARTVQGFGSPGLMDYPVKITAANDVTIAFGGQHQDAWGPTQEVLSVSSISGSIDRVTGDVEATSMVSDPKSGKSIAQTAYALQCRPAQRTF